MSRDLKSEAVRQRIVDTARALFLQHGYADTTIRQISAESGLSTGSIYHFFANKDDIFRVLVEELLQRSAAAADALLRKGDGPELALALELGLVVRLLSADERIASLFAAAHRAWAIRRLVLDGGAARNRALFGARLPHWDAMRYDCATLSIAGVMSALVEERLNENRFDEAMRRDTLLRAALAAFEVDAQTQAATLKTVAARLRASRG